MWHIVQTRVGSSDDSLQGREKTYNADNWSYHWLSEIRCWKKVEKIWKNRPAIDSSIQIRKLIKINSTLRGKDKNGTIKYSNSIS